MSSDKVAALQAEKDRLRSECDVLGQQAGACAQEVDRIRVEIGTVQAENERLTQVCTGLGLDLRIAEGERDDARMGEEIWALRCGVVLGRSPIPDASADLGRLPAETFWRAAGVQDRVRWEDCTFDERQRWAYAEGACIEKARGQAPEVQNLVAEIARLTTALAESERKRVELVATLRPFADLAEFLDDFDEANFSVDLPGGYPMTLEPFRAARAALASTPTQETARVED